MERPEKAIETVLAGLREVEAPAGMERRIAEAVRERAAAGAGKGSLGWLRWRTGWLETWRVGWGLGAVAVLGAVAILHTMKRAPEMVQRRSAVVESGRVARSKGAAGDSEHGRVAGTAGREAQARLEAAKSAPRGGGRVVGEGDTGAVGEMRVASQPALVVRRAAQRARVVDAGDAVAMSEMRAPSQPAPPLPLTEQERLLLRIAHKGDPVELAMLDPVQRDARNAEERAEFQSFFRSATIVQPTTGESKTEQPAAQSTTGQPTIEQPTTEAPTTGQSKTEQPAAQSTTGQPTIEQPTTEAPTTGQSKTEQPAAEPSTTGDNE